MSQNEGFACPTTGLWLLPARRQTSFRVQKSSYPALSAPARSDETDRMAWGRYDTIGTTLYLAQTAECAFSECLAPFKRAIGTTDPLQKDADALEMSLEDFYEEVASQWQEKSFMYSGTLPRIWRTERQLHIVELPFPGWWIDVEHPETMAAVEAAIPDTLKDLGVAHVDTGLLRSNRREVTTAIADHLRELVLFDGSYAHGIRFGSRHGGFVNWAVWLRNHDLNVSGGDGLVLLQESPIHFNDPDLEAASRRFKLKVF
ncbi:RES domain-containing protein [Paenarthrobacter nitroguajacolicus]|uniref:RES domain-containing protein n=1 Tax=Paenarthrobacter nitroguajacolicus TaxID=211146 RepID=UPI0015C1351F|nr:hypothetical protein [Paenarthrobacter nitroguajacolicus]